MQTAITQDGPRENHRIVDELNPKNVTSKPKNELYQIGNFSNSPQISQVPASN
jgi:hypothetical protein